MGEKSEQSIPEDWLKDLPSESSVEAYDSAEMIPCAKCARINPPTRLDCLYCGVELEISAEQSKILKPALRKTDSWINAFNLIYLSKANTWDEGNLAGVSKMLRLDIDVVKTIIDLNRPLPIARSEQEKEIEIVVNRFEEFGIQTTLLRDEVFQVEKPARRLRGIKFRDEAIVLESFISGEVTEVSLRDLSLIVMGGFFEKRVESTENHSKKKEQKILEAAETSVDELLFDIYLADDKIGYRVSAKGFDFSCLNEQKALMVNENIKLLIARLKTLAPNLAVDEDYLRVRGYLGSVWDVDEHVDSKGFKRGGFGKYNREIVTTTNNLSQFTKYSRLQWYLK